MIELLKHIAEGKIPEEIESDLIMFCIICGLAIQRSEDEGDAEETRTDDSTSNQTESPGRFKRILERAATIFCPIDDNIKFDEYRTNMEVFRLSYRGIGDTDSLRNHLFGNVRKFADLGYLKSIEAAVENRLDLEISRGPTPPTPDRGPTRSGPSGRSL